MILGVALTAVFLLMGYLLVRSYAHQMTLPVLHRYSGYRGIGAAGACCFVAAFMVLAVTTVLAIARA